MHGIDPLGSTVERRSVDVSPPFAFAPAADSATSAWQVHAAGVDRVPAAIRAAAARIKIAVIDTGADVRTPALSGRVAGAYDVRTQSRVVTDSSGHGTFVASLITGTGAGGAEGFGGAARVVVVRAVGAKGFTDLDVAAGILYAVNRGARIINLSIAGRARSVIEASAIRYAARHGVLIVAAAGNDALVGNPPEYPAALVQPVGSDGVGGSGLVAGASDSRGDRAPFSEFGSFISLAAPGVSVFGALPSAGHAALYGVASGTSFAAPEVAGAAALVWAANPRLTAQQVSAILERTASGRASWTPDLGFGVINVAAAVERASSASTSILENGPESSIH